MLLLQKQLMRMNSPFRMKFVPTPRCRGRGRGRGRPRVAVAQEVEPESADEPIAPEVDPATFAAGMTGINQGLATLNQAMPLVQQTLQKRNQKMTDENAAVLYTRVGRVPFDGTGDTMDFINTIEARTRTGYNDYQRLRCDLRNGLVGSTLCFVRLSRESGDFQNP